MWQGVAIFFGMLLSIAEHDGGWLWLVNICGIGLILLVAATQTEEA